MANNKGLPKTNTNGFPIQGSETDPTPIDNPQLQGQINQVINPATEGYYNSQKRKNNAITVLIYLGLTVVGLILAVAGFWFMNIREPIIRLEEKVNNLSDDTKQNTNAIEELKKFMYSNPPENKSEPQK